MLLLRTCLVSSPPVTGQAEQSEFLHHASHVLS